MCHWTNYTNYSLELRFFNQGAILNFTESTLYSVQTVIDLILTWIQKKRFNYMLYSVDLVLSIFGAISAQQPSAKYSDVRVESFLSV